jgi:3-deoxy-manno-octulosonate cytidylyltransferase (CMP-KDO synthetase)
MREEGIRVIGVIPARYGATRFKGKVLADLMGKPVIQRVYEAAKKAKALDRLIVATDDERVMKTVEGFGGKAILTSVDHQTGTDRLTEVVNPVDVKVVVNIQGDEPLVHHTMINELARTILSDDSINMTTIIKRIEDRDEIINPNVVKVVVDKDKNALYFSRSPIPFERNRQAKCHYKHLGLYAYTKDFLFTFTNLPKSELEQAESLEQLRAIEHGYKIKTIETKYETVGIDTPKDLKKAKNILKKRENSVGL